jgi:hypothetical protein|tara:strand:+ start:2278 stop:2946 length:669 start_codon:yes stop_codon:yes gene_type:complete
MAFVPLTRANIRTRLQRKTSNQLTDSSNQDEYIDDAEQIAISDWIKFDKGLMQRIKQSASTDAAGLLNVDKGFVRLLRLQDTNDTKYRYIDDPNDYPYATGYYFAGFDQNTDKREFMVLSQGAAVTSTTMEWWDVSMTTMAADSAAESAVPGILIVYKASEMWWEDQGSAFNTQAERMRQKYEELLEKNERLYRNPTNDPEWIESVADEAGEWSMYGEHIVS